jgi:hypothetical protein
MITDSVTLAMRDALLQATSPEDLLFDKLPACFGLQAFREDENRPDDMDRFFRGVNHCLDVLRSHAKKLTMECRNIVLRECGLPGNIDGWHELERRVAWLSPRVRHKVLTPFLNAVHNGLADNHNSRPTLSLIANRPFEQWSDMDIRGFAGLAKGIGEIFRQVWQNYGEPSKVTMHKLTYAEQKEKEKVRQYLADHIQQLSKNGSRRVVLVALQELLNELERGTR